MTIAPPITAHLVAPAAAPAVLDQPVVAAVTPVLVTVAHHQHLEAAVVLHYVRIISTNDEVSAHPVVDLVRVAVGVVVDAAAVVLELGASRVDTHTDRALGTNIYNAFYNFKYRPFSRRPP